MTTPSNARVLIVGGGSGIGHALALALASDGIDVVIGARRPEQAGDLPARVSVVHLDLQDEDSIAAVASSGPFNHVISLAAAHANGAVTGLDRAAITTAFDAKVIGPILLAKHLAPHMPVGGSFVFFSGVAAWAPTPGLSVMATANGAVAFLAEALAVELAPLRVVAISPGIIDSGTWDHLGEAKRDLFASTAAKNPARRVGSVQDIVAAVRLAMENGFLTGTTLHIDGGGRLA